MSRKKILWGGLAALLIGIAGCATTPPKPAPVRAVPQGKGVYHAVQSGETLWRIAKTYGVSMDDLIKSNNIPNVAQIEKNQLIFIPGADHLRKVVIEHDAKDGEFLWPIKGKVINYYGNKNRGQMNKGIDIQSAEGSLVCATRSGKVVFADYLNGYAYTVILDHADGFYSIYADNAKLMVKVDDYIQQGAAVAQIGRNGDLAYVHFEIRKNAVAQNPLFYLP